MHNRQNEDQRKFANGRFQDNPNSVKNDRMSRQRQNNHPTSNRFQARSASKNREKLTQMGTHKRADDDAFISEVDQILKGRMPIITREMVQHCIKTTRETGISRFGHKPTPLIRPAETPLKSMKDGYFVAGYINDKSLAFLVDTGSCCTILSKALLIRWPYETRPCLTPVNLH